MNFYFLKEVRNFCGRVTDPFYEAIHGAPSGNITRWQLIEHGLGSWHAACEQTSALRLAPRRFGSLNCDIMARCVPEYPETGVAALRDAKVIGSDGWIFTKENKWFSENTRQRNPWRWYDLPRSFRAPKRLKGRCLSIASDWGNNYSHFILDCLGRFAVFIKAGFTERDVDFIYCTTPPTDTGMKFLLDLGIPEEKIIFSDQSPFIQADEILVPSCPAQHGAPPSWVIDFLRKSLSVVPTVSERRVYVPRNGSRKLANESELLPILQRYGFDIFDHIHDDATALFAGCDVVAGPHGAGLVNALFCKRGTRLLELTPSDHCFPFYYTLAESAGLEFSYLAGRSTGTRDPGALISPFDFTVDPGEFEAALDEICTARVISDSK